MDLCFERASSESLALSGFDFFRFLSHFFLSEGVCAVSGSFSGSSTASLICSGGSISVRSFLNFFPFFSPLSPSLTLLFSFFFFFSIISGVVSVFSASIPDSRLFDLFFPSSLLCSPTFSDATSSSLFRFNLAMISLTWDGARVVGFGRSAEM